MPEELLCPKCNQTIENGAFFCGNCGFKLVPNLPNQTIASESAIPRYAVPSTHHKQHWAAMSLAFGILGICGGLLIPILGVVLGLVGLVLITSSFKMTHGWLKLTGSVLPALALLFSIGIWVFVATHNTKQTINGNYQTANGVSTMSVTTPCYTLSFNTYLNVNNNSGSCALNAYNGPSLASSTDVYRVLASETSTVNLSNFDSLSKQSLLTNVTKNLPGFIVTDEASSIFSGNPAYFVQALNSSSGVAVIEESVFHQNSSKDNFFLIVHALNSKSANLSDVETSWRWND
ncbi:MAG: hypothetical protein ACYCPS_03555 [Candidatus Saccharimonadales bacterium]